MTDTEYANAMTPDAMLIDGEWRQASDGGAPSSPSTL